MTQQQQQQQLEEEDQGEVGMLLGAIRGWAVPPQWAARQGWGGSGQRQEHTARVVSQAAIPVAALVPVAW